MRNDRRFTTRMIEEQLDLNHTTVYQVLAEELNMSMVGAKLVTKMSLINRMKV